MIDKELKKYKSCMGCHACYSICPAGCIAMDEDKEGFRYPRVNYEKCIRCSKCIDVCPIINKTMVESNPKSYACLNNDEDVRLDSSSGGMFTLIAEKIIDLGGVVFGAGFNDEFEVKHSYVEAKERLWQLRGSKYVQSKIGDSYQQAKKFLDSKRGVLFTGTPCQIAGLQSYLGKSYSNLITIDIICHGVPSPEIWRKYVEFRESRAESRVKRIDFRQKDEGWKRYSVLFLFKNNTEYRQNLHKDLYMRAFLKDVCLRPSCYDCKFKGLNRQSDITLADFWGIQNMLPEMDDDKGTSLIFVNSESGQSVFNEIKDGMIYKEVDLEEAVKYNSAAIKSSQYNAKRDMFMAEKDNLSFDRLVKKNCTDKLTIRIKRKFRLIIKKIVIKLGLMNVIKKLMR
ncbi:Coenzyme F420 hydrogenase/dehydrogenase, beta subunit C-terminal domain [Gottschalkiaceae bacterium SANA]|nr:Coenzyme F420 hydrogenase/dehydrogenase, beta subunit C-terminal domain [Gottschalkiaceae bacterium SANA]